MMWECGSYFDTTRIQEPETSRSCFALDHPCPTKYPLVSEDLRVFKPCFSSPVLYLEPLEQKLTIRETIPEWGLIAVFLDD